MATAIQTESTKVARTVANTDVPSLIMNSETAAAYIRPLLAQGVSLEQVAAETRLALAKDTTGALAKCSVGSVILSVAKICGWGLVVGETAHLVPFGGECTALRDYKGDIELAMRSGMVRHVEAHCVYAAEQFKIVRGFPTSYQHEPIADPKARGPMIGAYCFAVVRGNFTLIEWRTVEEVDAIRQKNSKQWKSGPVPDWYMKKTVTRQLLKPLPKSAAAQRAFAEIDERDATTAAQLDAAIADAPVLATGERMEARRIAAGPKALVAGGYDETPTPPAQHSADPGWSLDDADPAELEG